MSDNMIEYQESVFENIKHVNEYGQEFWYARAAESIRLYSVDKDV